MTRRVFLAGVAALIALGAPGVAAAQSTSAWGEEVFHLTESSHMVRLVRHHDVATGTRVYRFMHKSGSNPWNASHTQGTGVSASVHAELVTAADTSFAAFDAAASTALGTWYTNKSAGVKAMLHDVTRKTCSLQYGVRLELYAESGPATVADYVTLATAKDDDDRPTFDAAAGNAWGAWYTKMPSGEQNVVFGIVADEAEDWAKLTSCL